MMVAKPEVYWNGRRYRVEGRFINADRGDPGEFLVTRVLDLQTYAEPALTQEEEEEIAVLAYKECTE